MTEDKLANAMTQGRAQFLSIKELVEELRAADTEETRSTARSEEARQRIEEDPLCIQVRGGWHNPGDREGAKPAEYEILLCTGGPACRLVGNLSEHGEPETARIEVQDWFTPWAEWRGEEWDEEIALAYARCFWFGE